MSLRGGGIAPDVAISIQACAQVRNEIPTVAPLPRNDSGCHCEEGVKPPTWQSQFKPVPGYQMRFPRSLRSLGMTSGGDSHFSLRSLGMTGLPVGAGYIRPLQPAIEGLPLGAYPMILRWGRGYASITAALMPAGRGISRYPLSADISGVKCFRTVKYVKTHKNFAIKLE